MTLSLNKGNIGPDTDLRAFVLCRDGSLWRFSSKDAAENAINDLGNNLSGAAQELAHAARVIPAFDSAGSADEKWFVRVLVSDFMTDAEVVTFSHDSEDAAGRA